MNFPDHHFYCLYKCTLLGKIDFCILDFLMLSHFPTHKIGNCKIFLSANIIYPSSEVAQTCMSDSSGPHGLQPSRLLCPWDFPGKSTGVGCHFLLQGIFPNQGLNLGLPHCRQTLYPLSHQEIYMMFILKVNF